MGEPDPQTNPWSVVGDQPVRMPERTPPRIAVRKIVGSVLMSFGGIAIAVFLFMVGVLRVGIRHADDPNLPAITLFDVALTVATGMIGLTLIAAGYWTFRGSLPRRGKFPL